MPAPLLRCGVTAESESWILRTLAEEFTRRSADRLDAVLVPANEPLPADLDCVFYTAWFHYYLQTPAARSKPFVALVTHIDRFAFRLAWMARRRNCAIACMSSQWLRLLRRYAIPRRRLFLTPLGIDLELFQTQEEPPRPARTLLGIAGRLYPDGRKGERLLLDIASQLQPEHVAFSIIGTRWEEVVQALEERGFEVRYHHDVPADHLPALFAEPDALLICSQREGGPVTALEALASGTPVISTPVGYVPDLLAACPEAGRLFSDAEEAVRWIGDARDLKRAARSAYPAIRHHLVAYGWPTFTSHIATLLEQCVSAGKSEP